MKIVQLLLPDDIIAWLDGEAARFRCSRSQAVRTLLVLEQEKRQRERLAADIARVPGADGRR